MGHVLRGLEWTIVFLAVLQNLVIADGAAQSATRGVATDVPYILCSTCSHVAEAASSAVAAIAEDPLSPISEVGVLDVVESLCDAQALAGRWLRKIDLVERRGRLTLVPQQGVQRCNAECATLALACTSIIELAGEVELAEKLYSAYSASTDASKNGQAIEEWLCRAKDRAMRLCKESGSKLPPGRPHGPAFEPMDPKAIGIEDLQAKMKSLGMPGTKIVHRDEVLASGGGPDQENLRPTATDASTQSGLFVPRLIERMRELAVQGLNRVPIPLPSLIDTVSGRLRAATAKYTGELCGALKTVVRSAWQSSLRNRVLELARGSEEDTHEPEL